MSRLTTKARRSARRRHALQRLPGGLFAWHVLTKYVLPTVPGDVEPPRTRMPRAKK